MINTTSDDNGPLKFNGPHKILTSDNSLNEINSAKKMIVGNSQTCGTTILIKPQDVHDKSIY